MEETIQYLQIATNVIIILLFLGLVIMVFKLISAVKVVTSKLDEASSMIKDVKLKVEPVIVKVNDLTDNVNIVVSKVKENMDVLTTVVGKVKDTTENIIEFEENVRKKIEPPVMDVANTISAASIGIKTFFDSYMSRRKSSQPYYDKEVEELRDLKDSIDDVNKELEEVNTRLSGLQR